MTKSNVYVQIVQKNTKKFYKSHTHTPVSITLSVLRCFQKISSPKNPINTLGNTYRGEMDNFDLI